MVNDVKPGGVFLINCQWDADELNEKMPAEAKRYIAKNNIQLYTVNAIDIAAKIGLGKRTNTVLQSAFFSLAKILPEEEAIGYMKEKAQKFMKKGKEQGATVKNGLEMLLLQAFASWDFWEGKEQL